MNMRLIGKQTWFLLIGAGLALLPNWAEPGTALAHGKDITIEVSAITPDPQQPLTRLYRAFLTYADDREPVSGAVIYLSGRRRQGGEIMPPLRFQPLNVPGFYAAQVTYPRYGTWEMKLEVKEPGQGEASLTEEVLPAALLRGDSAEEAAQSSIFTISLSFNWRDVANMGMRWIHSLAAVAWFGLNGLIVAAFWFLEGEGRPRFLGKLYPLFPLAAGASLSLLAVTGIYNAVYNSPLRPPGVFSLEIMGRLPYGTAYLAVLSLKALTVGIGSVLAVAMARGISRAASLPLAGNPATAGARDNPSMAKGQLLLSLAAANLALGIAMLLGVAIMAYLHNLSHLAVLVPRQ
ncbi:MAG: hypothetical protein HYU86_06410 [Chloroflexi bacterium]|nr:hypothetical protein [Chloroflexota bacterium]